jgi:Zn-dependent peptidase ImmA (M78 family)
VSAAAAGTATRQRETEVCPSSEAALNVVGVKTERKIKKEAERDVARLLRVTLRDGMPVDPVAIARDLGVQVFDAKLDESTLGGLLMKPGEDPEIILNKRDGVLRRRLTCALELGYYVRVSAKANKYARSDLRGERASSAGKPEDVYAGEFAACLLTPKAEVEILAELGMDDLEMALQFLVPREAMQHRLKGLGLPAPVLEVA